MGREAVRASVANVIWQIGLPPLPSFATEQRLPRPTYPLSPEDLEAAPDAVQNVLDWPDRVATVLLNHKETQEYKEARRKSEITHGKSGLSASEQRTRKATREAKFDTRAAKYVAKYWHAHTLTRTTCSRWQWHSMCAYWNSSLQEHSDAVLSSADPKRTECRP